VCGTRSLGGDREERGFLQSPRLRGSRRIQQTARLTGWMNERSMEKPPVCLSVVSGLSTVLETSQKHMNKRESNTNEETLLHRQTSLWVGSLSPHECVARLPAGRNATASSSVRSPPFPLLHSAFSFSFQDSVPTLSPFLSLKPSTEWSTD